MLCENVYTNKQDSELQINTESRLSAHISWQQTRLSAPAKSAAADNEGSGGEGEGAEEAGEQGMRLVGVDPSLLQARSSLVLFKRMSDMCP